MNKPTESEFHTVRGYQLKKQNESTLTSALEDYLEMAYRLCIDEGYTRINKLSECLNVRPSSTSKMVSKLVDLGFLEYHKFDSILLTEKGQVLGAYLLERHQIIENFFSFIGSERPLEEAELVEHMLSSNTVYRIQFLQNFLLQNSDFHKKFKEYLKRNHSAISK